ncbi:hypothetical protein C8Q79DRAFT_48362 [Trametes meyenii]|nr:hypothetical protein C8Q79DRAFT_48362 [Trametes meyenii]
MVTRKRAASETLLPLRAPKQRRTTVQHPSFGYSSASQYEGLGARWMRLFNDFSRIARDTVNTFNPFRWGDDADELPTVQPPNAPMANGYPLHEQILSPPPSPTPSPPRPPRASTSARHLPPRPAIPIYAPAPATHRQPTQLSSSAPAASSIHQRTQSHPNLAAERPRPILTKYASMQANAVASTSKSALPTLEAPKASESSLRSAVTQQYPEVGVALEQSTHRRKKSVKKYIEREHIHAKQHKVRVLEEKRRTREEMEKDLKQLYHIRRATGYNSDFASFRSLVSYEAQLELIEKTGALSRAYSIPSVIMYGL